MRKYTKFIAFFSIVLMIILGVGVFAQSASAALVPCGPDMAKATCEVCDFFTLFDNIIRFITVDIVPALALLLIVAGAVTMIASGGSEEMYKKGKNIITMAIVGILIVWGSWLIIDTVMKGLTGGKLGTWNKIECPK